MADDHVAGNGVEQHLQHAAGAVLGQHLDKLDADDDVQRTFQKGADLQAVGIGQQTGHQLHQRDNAHEQGRQHNAGEHDFEDARSLGDLVAEDALEPFLPAVQGVICQASFGCNHTKLLVYVFFLFYHIFVPCTSKILQAVLKYDNYPPRPIKNDKKRRSKPFCTVFWLKCPPGACIFFAQRLHYNYRAHLTFIKGGSSVANAMQRIGFFAGVLYHHTLFTSTPQRSVS